MRPILWEAVIGSCHKQPTTTLNAHFGNKNPSICGHGLHLSSVFIIYNLRKLQSLLSAVKNSKIDSMWATKPLTPSILLLMKFRCPPAVPHPSFHWFSFVKSSYSQWVISCHYLTVASDLFNGKLARNRLDSQGCCYHFENFGIRSGTGRWRQQVRPTWHLS